MNPDDLLHLLPREWQPYLALAAAVYMAVFVALPAFLHPVVLTLSRYAGLTDTLWDDEVVGAVGRFARGLDWIHARLTPFIPSALAHRDPSEAKVSKGPPDTGSGKGTSPFLSVLLIVCLGALLSSCSGLQSVRRARTILASSAAVTAEIDHVLNERVQAYVGVVKLCTGDVPPESGCDELLQRGQRLRAGVLVVIAAAGALNTAEEAVDAWADGLSSCNAVAAIPAALRAVSEVLTTVEALGLEVPDSVDALLRIADTLTDLLLDAENRCQPEAS